MIQGSVESLCWVDNRLFSCGLHGFLLEYDLNKLKVKVGTPPPPPFLYSPVENYLNQVKVLTPPCLPLIGSHRVEYSVQFTTVPFKLLSEDIVVFLSTSFKF